MQGNCHRLTLSIHRHQQHKTITMSTTNGDSGEVPHCWICHEEGTNELGEPLRRDCSCRGCDAGYAHLSCLVEYAKHQTEEWDGHDLNELFKIWSDCLTCKQRHQNELRVELAIEFLSFVETNYSDDQGMIVAALYEKLLSLERMIDTHKNRCTPLARQEIKDIANKIFSITDLMKTKQCHLLYLSSTEALTHNSLGRIALEEGTEDSVHEALSHFEKYRDLSILLGLRPDRVAEAEYNISVAKEECGEDISIEKKVELSQKLYDVRLKSNGEGDIFALNVGTLLAKDLLNAYRLAEAESLLLKLATVSKQVHGADHSAFKKIHSVQRRLRKCKRIHEHRNKRLNRVLFLSMILASILSMYKISYGVSVVLSGGVTSLYLL